LFSRMSTNLFSTNFRRPAVLLPTIFALVVLPVLVVLAIVVALIVVLMLAVVVVVVVLSVVVVLIVTVGSGDEGIVVLLV
jgi:hypothetical protein